MASDTEQEALASLWQSAIAQYEKDTQHELSPNSLASLREIQSSEDLLKHIEASGQAFQGFRNKRSRLWHTLSSFVAPLAVVLKIATTPSSVSDAFGVPASAALGACLYLVRSCENVSNAYDWIEQVFTELQEFSERLDVYAQSRIDAVLRKKIVAILAFVLRVIGRSESLIKARRFRQYLRVTFLAKDEKTKSLVEDLNKLFGSEQRFVLAVTYATAQRIEEKLDSKVAQIEQNIKNVELSVQESKARETSAQVDGRIRRMLCGTSAADNVEDTFVRNKRSLLKGTGSWLQNEALFESWIDHRATILWILGGPGAGKTYLSTWLIKQLLYDLPEDQRKDISVAYFFVKENNDILRDANNILKTLAWQLVNQDPRFKEHAAEVSKQRVLTITAEDTWENLFLGYYARPDLDPRFASIVIDGLDEATAYTRRALLGFMKELVSVSRSSNYTAIQFAVIGRASLRNDVDITRQEKVYYIEISKHKNKEDIDSYIRKRLEEVEVLQEIRKVKHGLKRANKTGAAIKSKILEGADGVFLWAKLLIDTIVRKDLAQIDSILKEPPGSLDDMIWSVFDRLAKDEELDHELLRRMLLLCGYARRPLKFGELDLFLSLPSQKPNLLLWNQTRGKLSSVFEFKYPDGYNPDEEEVSGDDEWSETSGGSQEDRVAEDEGSGDGDFDFSGGFDDSDDGSGSLSDEDVFSPAVNHGLQSHSRGTERISTEKMMRHLSDGQLKTQVSFCHARIKDYLVREGTARSRRKPVSAIIPDAESVHVQMTIICLDTFRLELSLVDNCRYLVDYPMRFLALHLKSLEQNHVSSSETQHIVTRLAWLFGTERGAECFIKSNQDYDEYHSSEVEFYQTWVATEQNLRMVQDWFKRTIGSNDTELDVDSVTRAWIETAANCLEELLRPLMTVASKLWLTKPGHDSDDYADKGEYVFWQLHGWLSLVENGSIPSEVQEFGTSTYNHSLWLLSVERIEKLANWAGLEHDSHWHTCLGWILMGGHYYQEAMSHYHEAITQSSQAWVAMEGVARSYGELEEYQQAIGWQKKAIEAIPERMAWISGYLYPRIAEWSSKLGDHDLAFEAAKKGFDAESFSLDAQERYIQALYKREDWDTILETIEFLDYQIMEEEKYSWLERLILHGTEVYTEIGRACREKNQSAWVLHVLNKALKEVDRGDRQWIKVWLPLQVAKFNYMWYDDLENEAAKLMETFLERLAQQTSDFQEDYVEDRKWATGKLSQVYFDRATTSYQAAGMITDEVSVMADKLKALAVSVETSFAEDYDGFDFFRADYPALLWGRWLRDYKKVEEKVWKKSFKVRLLEEMNSLDDDDPTNDTDGMASLAVSLFHAGHRKDAAAILAILFRPLEDLNFEEAGSQEAGENETDNESEQSQGFDSEAKSDTSWEDVETDSQPNIEPENELREAQESAGEDAEPKEPLLDYEASSKNPARSSQGLPLNIDDWSWSYECDNCDRDPSKVPEFYFCEICLNINWCGECLAKLRDPSIQPNLREHACNPVHDMYQAWPIPEEARDLAAEYLEGEVELRKEWLERLRGEWMRGGTWQS